MNTAAFTPIEGITPSSLWSFFVVLMGLMAIYLVFDKVSDSIHKHRERRILMRNGPQEKLAEEICKKVVNSLEPRFDEIERKLATDKVRIDDHDKRLSAIDANIGNVKADNTMMLKSINILIMHEITGNGIEQLKRHKEELDSFLSARS